MGNYYADLKCKYMYCTTCHSGDRLRDTQSLFGYSQLRERDEEVGVNQTPQGAQNNKCTEKSLQIFLFKQS